MGIKCVLEVVVRWRGQGMGMVAEGEEGGGVLVEFCRFKWEGRGGHRVG